MATVFCTPETVPRHAPARRLVIAWLAAALIVPAASEAQSKPPAQTDGAGNSSRVAPAGSDEWNDLAVTEADRLYQVVAVRASVPPDVDGLLDDTAWDEAEPLARFVQAQPDEGADASERMEVRVLYDDEAIYIGARLWDSSPRDVVASVLRRDEDHRDNDAFAVTLDTYHDHRNGYFFETNALGARFDAQIIGEGGTALWGGGQRHLQQRLGCGLVGGWTSRRRGLVGRARHPVLGAALRSRQHAGVGHQLPAHAQAQLGAGFLGAGATAIRCHTAVDVGDVGRHAGG